MKTNSSGSVLPILSQLNKATNDVSKSFEKLASGKRINRAADDAAGLAIAEQLTADAATFKQASRNASDGISALSIADGALDQISQIESRKAELSAQAANGTLNDTQRQALNQEYQQLSQEQQRIAETTEFNGQKVFNSGSDTQLQVGNDSSSNSQITSGQISLSISSQDISTQAGAQSALDSSQSSIAAYSQQRGQIGAVTSRVNSAISNLGSAEDGVRAAESRIRDADIAEESARNVAAQIRQRAAQATLASANQSTEQVYRLLRG